MASRESIIAFLLSIPPEKLSEYCASSEKIAEICADAEFIEEYSKKHKTKIRERKKLRVSATKFLPTYPGLPREISPYGYTVSKKWHWVFETWAADAHYKGHSQGEIPHFNITPIRGGPILHVYLAPPGLLGNFLVIDELGHFVFVY